MTPDEQQRVADCVNACVGIGRPEYIANLIEAFGELLEIWNQGGAVAKEDEAAQLVIAAMIALDLQGEEPTN